MENRILKLFGNGSQDPQSNLSDRMGFFLQKVGAYLDYPRVVKDFFEIEKLNNEIKQDPENVNALLERYFINTRLLRKEDANRDRERILQIAGEDPALYMLLTVSIIDNETEKRRIAKRGLSLADNSGDPRLKQFFMKILLDSYRRDGDVLNWFRLNRRYLDLNQYPIFYSWYAWMGLLFESEDNFEAAEVFFREFSSFHLMRLYYRRRDYEKALCVPRGRMIFPPPAEEIETRRREIRLFEFFIRTELEDPPGSVADAVDAMKNFVGSRIFNTYKQYMLANLYLYLENESLAKRRFRNFVRRVEKESVIGFTFQVEYERAIRTLDWL